jgi:hypothetical protein
MHAGRRSTILAVAILLASSLLGPAAAHDHRPPRLLLEHQDQRQLGVNYHGWWTTRSGDACVGWDAVGPRSFPESAVREPDPKGAIRLVKRQKPAEVFLKAWQTVGVDGQPLGPATLVETDVRRIRGGRTRQWGVVFDPPFVGDNYLELFVEWEDSQRCGGAQGGYWGFHLFSESL